MSAGEPGSGLEVVRAWIAAHCLPGDSLRTLAGMIDAALSTAIADTRREDAAIVGAAKRYAVAHRAWMEGDDGCEEFCAACVACAEADVRHLAQATAREQLLALLTDATADQPGETKGDQ